MSELPKGWVGVSISDVADVKGGKRLPKRGSFSEVETSYPYIRVSDFENGTVNTQKLKFIDRETHLAISNYVISSDDLYISIAGTIGLVGEIPKTLDGANLTENAAKLCNLRILNKDFLKYFLQSPSATQQFIDKTTSSGQPKLALFRIKDCTLGLAPLAEQKRIVEKLDEVLAQVDTIKARLDGIPEFLKRFRQSVLASAVSGKLTEEWRGDNEYDEEGYPTSWLRKGLDDLGELARGKSKHRPRNDPRLFGAEYPFIQTGEVAQSNGVITSCSKWYSEFGLEQGKLFPKGTLCITIAANIADTAILGIDACFPDSVVGFTPKSDMTSALFVKYLIDVNKNRLEQFAPATAQKNINLKVLKSLSLPYPNLDEQDEIVHLVEQYFAFADTIEAQVKKAQARVDNLTQSILAKAFRGELVAQDPSDEPADKLLERIAEARKEAEALAKAARSTKNPAKKKAEKAAAKG